MKKEIKIPKNCPSCNSILVRIKDQLFCKNDSCLAKTSKQIVNFAKMVRIKGLGDKTIEKLGLSSIEDIYTITVEEIINILGEKLGDKLYIEINKARSMPLSIFLAANSIPLIGKTTAEKIAGSLTNPFLITKEYCTSKEIGEKATDSILYWIENIYTNNGLITFKTTEKTTGIKVCITGKISGYTKNTLKEYLLKHNITVVDLVSKNINYLICDVRKDSIKEKKADKLNIKIVTLKEIMEIINND